MLFHITFFSWAAVLSVGFSALFTKKQLGLNMTNSEYCRILKCSFIIKLEVHVQKHYCSLCGHWCAFGLAGHTSVSCTVKH